MAARNIAAGRWGGTALRPEQVCSVSASRREDKA